MSSHTIFVYADLQGVSYRVGTLWTRHHRGKESASFEYAPSWLTHPERVALEPTLQLLSGSTHTLAGHTLFGAIGDIDF